MAGYIHGFSSKEAYCGPEELAWLAWVFIQLLGIFSAVRVFFWIRFVIVAHRGAIQRMM